MFSVVLVLGEFIGPEKAAGGFANASDTLNPQLPRRAWPPPQTVLLLHVSCLPQDSVVTRSVCADFILAQP